MLMKNARTFIMLTEVWK